MDFLRDLNRVGDRWVQLPTTGTGRRDMFLGGDKYQGDRARDDKIVLGDRERGVVRRRTLLTLSANPACEQSLRLDKKRRAIDPTVRSADALRLENLRPALRLHGDPDADVLRTLTTDDGPLLPWQPGG